MTTAPTVNEPARVEALTLKDFTTSYRVSRAQAFRILASGQLTARKLGKRVLISRAEAERWFNSLPARHAA